MKQREFYRVDLMGVDNNHISKIRGKVQIAKSMVR